MSTFRVPATILPQFNSEFSRILNNLEKRPTAARNLGNDLFLKDLGLCRLDVLPCVAQIVDKGSGIPRKLAIRCFFEAPRELAAVGLRTGLRFAPFFALHTHTPMLKGFTPKGWDLCYLLLADLLKTYPEYQGVVGNAWFWDPELQRVSPWLTFLRDRPLSGGAFFLPLGQTPADIANATASEARRKLYLAGEYSPTGWFLIWPRASLLRWAETNREHILETASAIASTADDLARQG